MTEAQRLRTFEALRGRASELFGTVALSQGDERRFDKFLDEAGKAYRDRCDVIHGCFAIRDGAAVFVPAQDQDCPDLDALAKRAFHLVGYLNTMIRPEIRQADANLEFLRRVERPT